MMALNMVVNRNCSTECFFTIYFILPCKVNSLNKARECYYYLFHIISDQTNDQCAAGDCEEIAPDAYEEILDVNVANSLGRVRNGKGLKNKFLNNLKVDCSIVET